MHEQSPYIRGYNAVYTFGPYTLNPFLPNTEEFNAWKRGYDDSEVDRDNNVRENLQQRRMQLRKSLRERTQRHGA